MGASAFFLALRRLRAPILGIVAVFAVGMAGQPRRTADYPPSFATGNFIASICAYLVGLGMLIFLYAVLHSWRNGEIAPANPWGAATMEWMSPSPPPLYNFEEPPEVPELYDYDDLIYDEKEGGYIRRPSTGEKKSHGH